VVFKNHYYTLHRISFHILDISFFIRNCKTVNHIFSQEFLRNAANIFRIIDIALYKAHICRHLHIRVFVIAQSSIVLRSHFNARID